MIVCTLGDLLLDVVARLARLMVPGDDAPRLIDIGPGGESHAARPAGLDCGIELGLDAAALFVARQGTAA